MESYLPSAKTIETPYPLRCPLGSFHPGAKDYYLDNLRKVIQHYGAENIAALLMEPVNGSSGGAIYPPEGYWVEAQKILIENDILLLADEVMTGFGRTGFKFSCEDYEIKPDIMIAGKGMSSGYAAISGTYSTDKIANSIMDAGYLVMFHTFAALPLSCAAANTVLGIMRREKLCEKVAPLGERLKQKLTDALDHHPLVAEIRGKGLLIGIEIVKDKEKLISFDEQERITDQIISKGLEEGVLFYPGGTGEYRDIICLGPPYIIGDEEIDLMVGTLEKALNHIQVKYS
jgi:adenosylmethionine-8-amino-7-oxononanoate aminotransferase